MKLFDNLLSTSITDPIAGLQRLLSDLDLGNVHTDHPSDGGGGHGHDHGSPTVDQGFAAGRGQGTATGRGHGTGQDRGHDHAGHDHGMVPGGRQPRNKTTSAPPTQNPFIGGHGMHGQHDQHGHGHAGHAHRLGYLMGRPTKPDYNHRIRRRASHHDTHSIEHHAENDTFQQVRPICHICITIAFLFYCE